MHVTRLVTENVKRVKAVTIEPAGNLVVVSGRNGQGKSSVLDSIWLAIQGAAALKNTPEVIRHGEEEAFAEVDLGGLVVTRRWKQDGPKAGRLEVRDAEGVKQRSPQKLLDSLVGKLSFDPLSFLQLAPRDQRAQLLKLVELPFDLEKLEERRGELYRERTAAGQYARRLEGHVEELPDAPEDTPAEEASVAKLAEELDLMTRRHARAKELRDGLSSANRVLKSAELTHEQVSRELTAAAKDQEAALAAVKKIPGFLGRPDELRDQIREAEEVNAAVRDADRKEQAKTDALAAREAYQELHAKVDELEAEKAAGLKAAKFPVKGLSFDDQGPLFNDRPLVQASSSEQLKVSFGMAMASDPQIRIVRCEDGNRLDSEGRAVIEEMLIEHDFQGFLEMVSEDGANGIVIEDGQVAKVNK